MAESQGKGLKTPVNGLFHKNFEFEPLFGYDNFQNKIDTWETTVPWHREIIVCCVSAISTIVSQAFFT